MPFYKSLVHPHLEYSSQGQLSYLNEDINERAKGQRRAVELIRGIRIEMGAEARGWIDQVLLLFNHFLFLGLLSVLPSYGYSAAATAPGIHNLEEKLFPSCY